MGWMLEGQDELDVCTPEMMFLDASRAERLGKLPLTPQSTGSWPVSPVFTSFKVCICTIIKDQ